MTTEAATPRIIFTNAVFAAPTQAHLSTPGRIGEFARGAGYDGVEWTPLYWPAWMVRRAVTRSDLDLNSQHQAFRTGRDTHDINGAPEDRTRIDKMLSLPGVGRVFMPEAAASARYMRAVTESSIFDRRPGVFYPHRNADKDAVIRNIAGCSIDQAQPTDHVARLLSAHSPGHLARILLERGYGGSTNHQQPFIYDTFHGRRRYGADSPGVISDPSGLQEIARWTGALHIGLNRREFAARESHIPTRYELKGVLSGTVAGELGDMLDIFGATGKLRYVVVETGAADMTDVTGHTKPADLQQDYAAVAHTLRDVLHGKGAQIR